MLTNKLDLRVFPVFHWHVEEEVATEFLTGIKGDVKLDMAVGEWVILQPSGVRFKRLSPEVWEIKGYSPDVVQVGKARIQQDVWEVVQKVIDFAEKVKSGC